MIKKFLKHLIYREQADSDSLIDYLKRKGATIGKDVHIFNIRKSHIDTLNPHLIVIGDHVNITGATILTHDYSWSVLKRLTGAVVGNQKPVIIGNNCFIGFNSVILAGSKIGDNVIIGANSVVSGVIDSDSVYAGNPAVKIMDIHTFFQKRLMRQFEEAKCIAIHYYRAHKKIPPKELFHEYFYIFTREIDKIESPVFENKLELCGNKTQCIDYLRSRTPQFDCYESFIKECLKEEIL